MRNKYLFMQKKWLCCVPECGDCRGENCNNVAAIACEDDVDETDDFLDDGNIFEHLEDLTVLFRSYRISVFLLFIRNVSVCDEISNVKNCKTQKLCSQTLPHLFSLH